ncbi:MAG: tetratricopeptide repeat protein [bacterium]
MRRFIGFLFTVALLAFVAGASWARPPRKLNVDAYIKTAKIEILSGDPERYLYAAAMLDSLFMNYGPHAEGYYLCSQMAVDGIETSSGPVDKLPYVQTMVAYADSLRSCCADKKVKEKYRKGCDEFVTKSDSVGVLYWRQFYNAGIEQLKLMDTLQKELATLSDSSTMAYLNGGIAANYDSCKANFALCLTIDSADTRAYVAMGTAYQQNQEYDQAITWRAKGLDLIEAAVAKAVAEGKEVNPEILDAKATLLQTVAYDYINLNNYAEAVPYMARLIEVMQQLPQQEPASVVTTMFNLSICLNNTKQYDSALSVFHSILDVDPNHVDAISGVGRYYNEMGRWAADSVKVYEAASDDAGVTKWQDRRQEMFDSSRTYFKRAFDINPDDEFNTGMYALVSAITMNFEDAAVAFQKMTELEPENAENFISLGDCNLNLKRFEQAIAAYEKVVELKPNKKEIWQQLADLYHQQNMSAKEAEARKHL